MANYIYSDEFLEAYAEILVECWADEEFAERFKKDALGVLKEWEIEVGDIKRVDVVESTEPGVVTLALPPKPAGFDELSDDDLDAVAGGNMGEAIAGGAVGGVSGAAIGAACK